MRTIAELQARTLEWAADEAPSDPTLWRIWIRARASDIRDGVLDPDLNFGGSTLVGPGDLPAEIVERAVEQSQREYEKMLDATPPATGPGPTFIHSDEDPPDDVLDQIEEQS